MSANLDDFLPGVFRKRKPIIKDEWGGPSNQNILDQASSGLPVDRGAPPVVPASPNVRSYGLELDSPDPTAANVGQDSGGTGTTRTRRVETDEKGRPVANTTMTGDAQAVDLNQRIHSYHPQASQGWWDKWGREMVTGAVKGLRYGPGGALGGAIAGGVRGATNPELADEQWKDEQIASSDADIKRITAGQQLKTKIAQEAAQTANTQANTALAQGRLRELGKPKLGAVHHDVNAAGNMVIVDAQGLATEVHDKDGKPVKKLSDDETLMPDTVNTLIVHKLKHGQDTGISYVKDPQFGYVPSGAAAGAAATLNNRALERTDKANQDILTNAQLDENIRTATQSRDAMGSPPPVYIEKTSPLGDKEQVVNPAYNEWQSRRTAYDSQIAGWKAQKKAVPATKPSKRYAPKLKSDPLGLFK